MSIYSNVTEEDMINLRRLAQQQKEQRALKIKNRILKQTHDEKLAESLSPITKKLDETSEKLGDAIKESTQSLGNVVNENNQPQLAIENTPQPIIENNQPQQPIENNEGDVYDVELENTLNKMTDNTGFFKTQYDRQRGWILNNYPIKTPKGTNIEINEKEYNITPGLQKVLTDHSYDTAKSMSDKDKLIFRDFLVKTGYYKHKPGKGRMQGRDRYIRYELDNDVIRIMDLKTKLKGRGIEKIIIPNNIIDIYTRLEVLLGLKLSGHNNTLTEASALIDELYRQGEIRDEQQYRNALNKFQT